MPDKTHSCAQPAPPVLLYPMHGCDDVQMLTEEQHVAVLRAHRITLRRHWRHEGVQSLVHLMELTCARLTQQAILPGAAAHEAGQAYGALQLLQSIRAIVQGQEDTTPGEDGQE